jgi:hypothetical protein
MRTHVGIGNTAQSFECKINFENNFQLHFNEVKFLK